MMDLTPAAIERLKAPGTKPWFVVQVELDEVMHLATGCDAAWGDIDFKAGLVRDFRFSQEAISISIFNADTKHTMPALLGAYQRKPINIWYAPGNAVEIPMLLDAGYVEEGYYEEPDPIQPILVFSGRIAHTPAIDDYIHIIATRSAARRTPQVRIVPPFANWVAPAGTVINFNGQIIRVRSRL